MATFSPTTVSELIDAIEAANSNGQANMIELAASTTYTLSNIDNNTDGPNGLPSITGEITINGNGATIERDDCAPGFRIIHIAGTGTLTLNDLTVKNGKTSNHGGGIYGNSHSILTINDSTLFNNESSVGFGGGIYHLDGILAITGCNIYSNICNGVGGGLYHKDGSFTIIDSHIHNNQGNHGGGVGIASTNLSTLAVITRCLIELNEATTYDGGGIWAEASTSGLLTFTLTDSTISENTAGRRGGGICSAVSVVTIKNCLISNNEGSLGGGCNLLSTKSVDISNCRITDNESLDSSGGIYVASGENTESVCINYSHLSDNQSHTSSFDLYNHTPSQLEIDAQYNWWGSPDGPIFEEEPGSRTSISSGIGYCDFFTVSECPHQGPCECTIGVHACGDGESTSNPISLQKGEKRLEATDLTLTTPAGPLSFTRTYRQNRQDNPDFQFMGLGWTHNHQITLTKISGTPNAIIVKMPRGGIATFTETQTDHYEGDPGATSVIDWNSSTSQYTLKTLDESEYVFDGTTGNLLSRLWTNGETWTYSYDGSGNLIQVADAYSNQLVFRYITSGSHAGQLYRVGDHTFDDTDPQNPTGRYAEFGYTLNKIVDTTGTIVDGSASLLTSVQDVLGEIWTYSYYAETAQNADVRQLNFLIKRESPWVDTDGDQSANRTLVLEELSYTMQGEELAVNGGMEADNNDWTDLSGAAPNTNEQSTIQVDNGTYSRHIDCDAANEGIEGLPWDLVNDRTYIVTARVYPVSGAVKMQVTGRTDFDRITGGTGTWETLRAVYKATSDASGVNLQFIASGGPAEFYVDTVSVIETDMSITTITQQRGEAALATDLNFSSQGFSTTETISNTTIQTIHRFFGGVRIETENPLGGVHGKTLNTEFRPDEQTDANGNTTQLTWSADGKHLDQVIDALENSTEFNYNTNDTLDYSLDAEGRKTAYVYGDTNNPRLPSDVMVIDVDGTTGLRWQKFVYDTKGRITSEKLVSPNDGTTVLQETTRSYYGDTAPLGAGLLYTVTQQEIGGSQTITTTYFYDGAGRVVQTNQNSTVGSCTKSYTVFDVAGNILATICNYEPDTNPAPTTAAEAVALYDPANPGKNRVTTYIYDELGRQVSATTDAGATIARTNLTFYDALNRVWRTIANYNSQGSSAPGNWVWNNNSNCWEDGDENTISHGVDNHENIIADTEYNRWGLVKSRRDVLGQVTLYGYDNAGRLVKTVQNAATPDHNNDYVGTSPNESDPSLTAYPYSPNVLSTAPDEDIISEQVYDAAGNLIRTIDALGNVTVTIYDALNRPITTVRNPSNPYYYFAGDPELSEYTLSAGPDADLVEKTTYDALGRVEKTERLVNVSGGVGEWIVTRYVYDELDRQYRLIANYVEQGNPVVDPVDWTWVTDHWEYDSGTPVDHGDNDQNLVTHTEYGNDGRLLWTRDPEGKRTWHVYDGFGRQVLTVANYAGGSYELPNQWVWESGVWKDDVGGSEIQHGTNYDENVISQTAYDADGRVTWTRDTRGNETHYAYDMLGRQSRVVRNFHDDGYIDTDINQWVWDNGEGRWEDKDGLEIPRGDDKDRNLISSTSYDLAGRVSVTRDAAGAETRYAYDHSGRQSRVVRNFYDDGYINTDIDQWVWDNGERRWEDGGNIALPHGSGLDLNLISETTYNVAGQVESTRDVRGTQTVFVYDGAGRRVVVRQAAGTSLETRSYTCFNKAGQVLRTLANWVDDGPSPDEQDANGDWVFAPGDNHGQNHDQNRIVEYTYDTLGRRVTVTDPVGNVTTTTYLKSGQVNTVADPEGVISLYRYDNLHRRYLVVQNYVSNGEDPSLWVWDANQTPDPRWEKSDGTAIDHGVNNDQNIMVELTYDLLGRRTSLRDPRGNVTQYTYDQLGRRIKLTNPLNREWVTEYEDVKVSGAFTGETRVRLTDPRNYETERKTDRLGRLTSIGYGDPANTYDVVFTYDAAGNRTLMAEYSDTAHQTEARITQFSYDSARRLVNVGFDHDGDASVDETVSYEYDLSGHRTQLTLPGSLDITYVYDQKGRLISLTDWDGHETQFAYDNANRLIAAERANALRSRYTYDSAGRLRLLRHTQGRKTLAHFAYEVDGRGNRTQALELLAHPTTTDDVTYTYDDVSIVYQGIWTDDASTYKKSESFSASLKLAFFGQNVSFTVATGVNHSLFDVYINGSLWQSFDGYAAASGERTVDIDLTSDGPHLFEIRNRAEHSLAAKADSNYDEHTFIVRFKQLTVPDMAYDLRTLEYTYDDLARLTETRVNPGIHTGAADVDLLRRSQHIYDVAGNRIQEIIPVLGTDITTDYEYNAANQILRTRHNQGTWLNLTYDANGNLTDDGINFYTWDRANRLRSTVNYHLILPPNRSYRYDGLGNRIGQDYYTGGFYPTTVMTDYLLDLQPGLPLVLAQATSGNTDRFIHGPRGIHAQENNSGIWTWPLTDGLGSVRGDISDAVVVNGVQSYTDYGTPVDSVGTFGFPFTFTGEMVDANALVYLRARYYHPGLGVFTSLDPVEGVNRYQYVSGNVTNMVDPSGLQSCEGRDNSSAIDGKGDQWKVVRRMVEEFDNEFLQAARLRFAELRSRTFANYMDNLAITGCLPDERFLPSPEDILRTCGLPETAEEFASQMVTVSAVPNVSQWASGRIQFTGKTGIPEGAALWAQELGILQHIHTRSDISAGPLELRSSEFYNLLLGYSPACSGLICDNYIDPISLDAQREALETTDTGSIFSEHLESFYDSPEALREELIPLLYRRYVDPVTLPRGIANAVDAKILFGIGGIDIPDYDETKPRYDYPRLLAELMAARHLVFLMEYIDYFPNTNQLDQNTAEAYYKENLEAYLIRRAGGGYVRFGNDFGHARTSIMAGIQASGHGQAYTNMLIHARGVFGSAATSCPNLP